MTAHQGSYSGQSKSSLGASLSFGHATGFRSSAVWNESVWHNNSISRIKEHTRSTELVSRSYLVVAEAAKTYLSPKRGLEATHVTVLL